MRLGVKLGVQHVLQPVAMFCGSDETTEILEPYEEMPWVFITVPGYCREFKLLQSSHSYCAAGFGE